MKNQLLDERGKAIGKIDGSIISNKNGPILEVVGDELITLANREHVGFFWNDTVFDRYRKPVASLDIEFWSVS